MRHFILLELILFIPFTLQTPQIFREIDTCKIPVQKKDRTNYYTVPAVINAKNNDFRVTVTLCNKKSYTGKDGNAVSTISVYNGNGTSLIKSDVVPKPYDVSQDKEEILVILQNRIKCNEDSDYSITIKLREMNAKLPRLTMNEDCLLEIEIVKPDYNPKCMNHVEGKWFIDLTPFRNKPITVSNGKGDKYLLSLCGPIRQCKQQAGCKIGTNGDVEVIGLLQKAVVKFDGNVLEVFSSTEKPNRKTMRITLKCRWDVKYFSKPKLLNEGTNHKFEVQSSFGCIKTPQKCALTDENQHLTFDLTSLRSPSGITVPNRNIKLNLCGDLRLNWPRNLKNTLERSQVCEINGKEYVNRGSILNLGLEGGNLRARLVNGGDCNENETYSTVVDFKCSRRDTGPVFNAQEGCLTKLTWETPKACPKFQIIQDSCTFFSIHGSLNLTELYKIGGYSYDISPQQRLVYNLCGKLKNNCSTSDDVSICLHDGQIQRVIGWNKPLVTFEDGELKLEYKGQKCDSYDAPYTFTMNLACSYEQKILEPVVKRVDHCSFVSTVYTSSACLKSWEIKKCTINTDNYKYDLSSLTKRTENYNVRDPSHSDVMYFLNLCTPLVPGKGLLFYHNSMVYMLNSSIPSITKKFTLIGYTADPGLKDGELIVESLMGDKCNATSPYSSRISFECSDEEGLPYFQDKQGCRINFVWRTRHACPVMKKGGTCNLTAGNTSVKVPGDPIEARIDNYNTYFFSLCLDYYRWCRHDGNCSTKKLSKTVEKKNGATYISYTLEDSRLLQTVGFKIECDPFIPLNFTTVYRRRDHLDIFLKTRVCCTNGKQISDAVRSEQKRDETYRYDISNHEVVTNQQIDQQVIPQKEPKSNNISTDVEKNITNVDKLLEKTKKDDQQKVETEESIDSSPQSEKNEDNDDNYTKINLTQEERSEKSEKDAPISLNEKESYPSHEILEKTVEEKKICQVSNAQSETIDIYDLESIEFKNRSDIYIFNFNGGSTKCKGLFCKNGDDLLSFIEKCPEISYRDDRAIMTYTTSGHCIMERSASSPNMVVEVILGCNKDRVLGMASEKDCKVTVEYFSPKICYTVKTSNAFMIVIVAVLFSLFFVCSTVYILYKKDYFRKCSYDSVSENDALVIHSKML